MEVDLKKQERIEKSGEKFLKYFHFKNFLKYP